MDKFDLTDKGILIELDSDASQSLKSIARKLRLSREVIAYRVKRLENKGIILKYLTLSNFTRAGLTHFKLYIKFGRITRQEREDIVAYLAKFPSLGWLASTEGLFDLMFSIRFRNKYEFEEFKDEFFRRYDAHFRDVKFAVLTEAETKPRYYILDEVPKEPHVFFHVGRAKEELLDEVDTKVLAVLGTNANLSSLEIARRTGLTERVVRYRRAELEKRGVIVGYKLAIDYRKLNYLFFKCFVTLRNMSEQRYKTLKQYVRQHPNFIYWIKTIGSWDLELEIEVPSIEDFYKVVADLKERFPDIIESFDASLVSKEHAIVHA